MNEVVAALARFPLLLEQAVHGPDRAQVLHLVQQGGVDGGQLA
jgi:hypothetical protein